MFEDRPDMALIAERVRPIAEATPGLRGLSIYGSRARGDFREDSDYDFMAVFDPGHYRDLMLLGVSLGREFDWKASVYDSEGHSDRWRRRIKADLVCVWGEPVDWPGIVPMSREEAERDRLAFQLEYIHHTAGTVMGRDISTGIGMLSVELLVLGLCNTLRNVDRHSHMVYEARFGDIVPDPAGNQSELEEEVYRGGKVEHPLMRVFIGILPVIMERAGEQLDEMGYGRPGESWTTGLGRGE